MNKKDYKEDKAKLIATRKKFFAELALAPEDQNYDDGPSKKWEPYLKELEEKYPKDFLEEVAKEAWAEFEKESYDIIIKGFQNRQMYLRNENRELKKKLAEKEK